MKFELELDIETFHKETSRNLGVVFTEDFIRRFMSEDARLLGALAGVTHGSFDTYERDWLMEEITDKLIGMHPPLNMDSDEYTEEFNVNWLAYISDSEDVDHEKSKEYANK